MKNFIGLPLSQVINELEKTNTPYEVVMNNFIIEGDTKLVTNVKSQNNKVVLTVGEFIFNLKKD
ncbi:MAG: hypothetical protein ACOX6H_03710 [Christensenellales bacterium]|jgi:hypothetical protein